MAEKTRQRIVNLSTFDLLAKHPNEDNKVCRLVWGLASPYVLITVFINGSKGERITANLNLNSFNILMDELNKLASGENNKHVVLNCYSYKYNNETNKIIPDSKYVSCKIYIGKNQEGICWISLIGENITKVVFNFVLSEFNELIKTDGTELTKSDLSCLAAKSISTTLPSMYTTMISNYYQNMNNENFGINVVDDAPVSASKHEDIMDDIRF